MNQRHLIRKNFQKYCFNHEALCLFSKLVSHFDFFTGPAKGLLYVGKLNIRSIKNIRYPISNNSRGPVPAVVNSNNNFVRF